LADFQFGEANRKDEESVEQIATPNRTQGEAATVAFEIDRKQEGLINAR
jgi:hypothetical protein